jgi:hypothetical protein
MNSNKNSKERVVKARNMSYPGTILYEPYNCNDNDNPQWMSASSFEDDYSWQHFVRSFSTPISDCSFENTNSDAALQLRQDSIQIDGKCKLELPGSLDAHSLLTPDSFQGDPRLQWTDTTIDQLSRSCPMGLQQPIGANRVETPGQKLGLKKEVRRF